MGRATNRLVGGINFVIFLVSIVLLGAGIWLSSKASTTDCLKLLQWPIIILGAALMAISLLGFLAIYLHLPFLLILYLVAVFLLVVALLGFTIFAFVVTAKGGGRPAPGVAFLEYHLEDYSGWLKNRVSDPGQWRKIRSCLVGSKTCKKMGRLVVVLGGPPGSISPEPPELFFRRDLPPVESGCCKPPMECQFTYMNETVWVGATAAVVAAQRDCEKWSNDQGVLCYECNSCKASVLEMVKKRWKKVGVISIVVIVVLLVLFAMACLALRRSLRFRHGESFGEARMIKSRPSRFHF
ncbi:tetraspanin-3-like [Wolffia australiana]